MDATDARELARGFQLVRAPADFIDDPYPYYAALREHDPVHELEGGGVFLSRYEDALAVYRDPRASSDKKEEFRPKLGDTPLYEHHTTSLVFNDPPLHTRVRRIIMGALNQRAIARMEADVVRLVDALLERMAAKRELDFIDEFAANIPIEVIGNLLDVPRSDRGPLRGWSVAILSGLEPKLTPAMHEAGNRAVSEFVAYLKELIAARRQKPGDYESDVLTRLIQGEDQGERLSGKELVHNCIFLLNAGHETTTNLIGNGLVALAMHPDQKAVLLAQPDLVRTAVEEVLRLESSNQLGNRITTQPASIGGHAIPERTSITLCIGAANRDPERFADPDRFDIRRSPNRHLAFGSGIHQCAGMNLARLEGSVAISGFLQRFPRYALTAPPTRGGRARFRGFLKIPCRVNA